MKNKVILVTGGAGYIGSHTIIELVVDNSFEIVSVDNYSNSSARAYQLIEKITGKKIKHYNIDLSDLKATEKIFLENEIDGIIHFAAFKSVGESVINPLKYYQNNINSLANILFLSLKYKINNFIFSSSCSVYGNTKEQPVTENTELPKPESPYAYTKQIGEKMIKDVCKIEPQFNNISLRYFNPAGAHVSGNIGEDPINKPSNLVPVITAFANNKINDLFINGGDYPTQDGTCIRDYIHVSDVASAHVLALKYLISKKQNINYDVFNLGTGEGVSVLEAIQTFERITNNKLKYKIGVKREGDPVIIYANCDKAKAILNWRCKHKIDSILSTAWKWELNK